MLRFFFYRFSPIVVIVEIVGWLLMAAGLVRCLLEGSNLTITTFLTIDIALALFLRFCATKRWYRKAPRFSGIELQFKKALVPHAYILTIAGTWFLATRSLIPLAIALVMLGIVGHVNVILLYLFWRDRSTTPVNFYSRGMFLANPPPPPAS